MPAVYSKHPVNLIYPENWQLSETGDDPASPGVTLESPEGSFIVIQYFASMLAVDQLLDDMTRGLESQYEDIETTRTDRVIGGQTAKCRESFFFCLDFLVKARMLVLDVDKHRVAVLCQAESVQFDRVEPVFDAILTGMLNPPESPDAAIT